jgi:hypothetical protein
MGDPRGPQNRSDVCTRLLVVPILLCLGRYLAGPTAVPLGMCLNPCWGGTESRHLRSRGRTQGERIAAAFNPLWSIRIYSKTEMHV